MHDQPDHDQDDAGLGQNEREAVTKDVSDQQQSVILFYKYHPLSSSWDMMEPYRTAMETLCRSLNLRGRVLIGCSDNSEGINGTLAGQRSDVKAFTFALLGRWYTQDRAIEECVDADVTSLLYEFWEKSMAFAHSIGVPELTLSSPDDFKWSASSGMDGPLFPDLNVKLVNEVVSTGGVLSSISVDDTSKGYLTPKDWHAEVMNLKDDTLVIDCRNAKECSIGRFPNAINPHTTTFAQFPRWVQTYQHELHNKRVLMYCTGGIRCEKASAYIRKELAGVKSVSHLQGGVHKYLEVYGCKGLWEGKNFVFDRRGAVGAIETQMSREGYVIEAGIANEHQDAVVGRCLYCQAPYDTFHASCVCTVCREPTLVCQSCRTKMPEYHCVDHFYLRHCYFTNLGRFSKEDLASQLDELQTWIDKYAIGRRYKRRRKTLQRQLHRIQQRLQAVAGGHAMSSCPVVCRHCSDVACNGSCWGFHGLGRKEKLAQCQPLRSNSTEITVRSARRSANHRVSKVRRHEQSVEEIQQLGLSLPPSRYRDDESGIRIPPPCVRVLRTVAKGKWNGKSLSSVLQQEFEGLAKDEMLVAVVSEGLLRFNDDIVTMESLAMTMRNMDVVSRVVHWHEPPVVVPHTVEIQRIPLPEPVLDEYGISQDAGCIIVCNKPPSVPVYPTGPYLSNSLTLLVEAQEELERRSLHTCHRIDRATSGLTIFTTHPSYARLVQSKMEAGLVRKLYLALVKGRFPCSGASAACVFPTTTAYASCAWVEATQCFQVDAPIQVVDPQRGIRTISHEGKHAISRFQFLAYDATTDCSLLSCCPLTGRGHQLRLHLQWLGFPIVGDIQYGGAKLSADKQEEATRLMTKVCNTKGSGFQLRTLSDADVRGAIRACKCCQGGKDGIEASFTAAQLLGEGHIIYLHALRYEVTFEKKKKSGDAVSGATLARIRMEVGVPDWAEKYTNITLSWLQERVGNQTTTNNGLSSSMTQSHYEAHSASSYEAAYFYSPGPYMNYLVDMIVTRLGWSSSSTRSLTLLDVGGGTGNFTRKIVQGRPAASAIVVDPFLHSSSDNQIDQVRFVKATAESFATPSAEWWRQGYHQVLMKEIVHHLQAIDRLHVFQGIQKEAMPTGDSSSLPTLLIVTRPQYEHDYPLWKEANQVWADNQPSLDDIRSDLQRAGFRRVEHSVEAYLCSTPLNRWLAMIKSRFWSTFSSFTDEELEEACNRITADERSRIDHDGNIQFEDRLLLISAFK